MTYLIYKTLAMVGACCMSLLFLGGTALALTPDGETPAMEQYCNDNFTGKARGLCNAYCEATDCHLQFDMDATEEPHASEKACNILRGKFITAAQDADTSIPPGSLELCAEACVCIETWTTIGENGAGAQSILQQILGGGALTGAPPNNAGCLWQPGGSNGVDTDLYLVNIAVAGTSVACNDETLIGPEDSRTIPVMDPGRAVNDCAAYLVELPCSQN